ncbi:MAG: ArsA family ATPase [Zestosphaera sp.]
MSVLTELLKPLEGEPHVIVVLGKGGVGKTSTSILVANELRSQGRTLLVSFDPAKHILKYLGLRKPMETVEVAENLSACQLDIEASARKLMSSYSDLMAEMFPSLTVLNLEDVTKALKYAPGVEEEVFLRWLADTYEDKGYKHVVVDTPPTGVSLRTLALPRLYLLWLDKLINIRERIVSLRYVIAKTLGKEFEMRDPALKKLYELKNTYSRVKEVLSNPLRTSYIVVTNPEPLPMFELREILNFLENELTIKPKLLVMNKVLPDEVAASLGTYAEQAETLREFRSIECRSIMIPHASSPPSSLEDIVKLRDTVVIVRGYA